MSKESDVALIIDNGSGVFKTGRSTEEMPSGIFPATVGRPRKTQAKSLEKEVFCGNQINDHPGKLLLSHPIENGIIENFEHMELLWEYTFMEVLKADPTEHPLLLTEPPYNPKPNREKVVETMFETFGVPSLNISIQGVLALLGQGRTTGLVLDSGEGVTHTMPIADGYGQAHCINRLDLAGRELNTLLGKLLAQQDIVLTSTEQQQHVRKIKEQHCYVALEPSSESAETTNYTMPDGQVIPLDDERWRCPEALFNPALVGLEAMGAAELVWESISRSALDYRKSMLANVVLSGGSTMFSGFSERLERELKNLAPSAAAANIKVVTPKDRRLAVWSGAQVSASLRSAQWDKWMTSSDFEECGVGYIHDKLAIKYD